MQFVLQLLGKLVLCVGIMLTVVSCVLGSVAGTGTGGAPFMGIALIIGGGVLWHRSSNKTCPSCAERVKYQARKCPHCGADLLG